MSKATNSTLIDVQIARTSSGNAIEFGLRFLSAAALGVAFLFVVHQSLGLDAIGASFWVMCASCAAGCLVALLPTLIGEWLARRFGSPHALVIGLGLFALVVVVAAWGPLAIGLNSYLNCASDVLTGASGTMQAHFADGGASSVGVLFFTVLISAIVGVVAAFTTRAGSLWAAFVLPVIAGVGIACGLFPLGWEVGLFFAVAALSLVGKAVRGGSGSSGVRAALPAVALSAAGCALAIALVASTGLYRVFDAAGAPQTIAQWRHSVAYESEPNILPEGDLRNIEAFVPTGRTELSITMDAPETVYLRGFVGEHYSDGVWGGLTPDENRTYRDLFYTLHQQGFYGQSQLAGAYEASGQTGTATMTISNIGACRHYLYAPYGFSQSDYLRTNERLIGDAAITSSGGAAQWGLAYVPGAVGGSYVLQTELDEAVSSSERVRSYLQAESAYRDMVYDVYLGLSKEHIELLEECLGQREHLSTTQARSRIATYLANNQYYQSTAAGNAGQDALEWFLSGDRIGHSVHYAMAATCMLRYFGVPARYVEGYVVTSDVVQASKGSVDVTDRNAHAWAEFYLDGVGWLPFETTPGFRNDNMYAYPGIGEDGIGGEIADVDEDEEEWPEEEEEEGEEESEEGFLLERIAAFLSTWGKAILLGLFAALLAIAVAAVVARRARLGRLLALFDGPDRRTAVLAAFSYAVSIISSRLPSIDHTLLDQADDQVKGAFACGDRFGACVAANDRARFSTHEITEEQRSEVVRFARDVLEEYKGTRNFAQRLYDRIVLCLY